MLRSISMALAAVMAVGAGAVTLSPANAGPVRAMPLLAEQTTGNGVQQVHDNSAWLSEPRWRGYKRSDRWRYSDRDHKRYYKHRRYSAHPQFYFGFGFPYVAPRSHYQYYPKHRRSHRYW